MNLDGYIARIKAYLLKNSPSVISVGARVCLSGFAFVWFPGFSPGIIAPNGMVIALLEKFRIPYISARVIHDAMRDQDNACHQVGVCVHHGELKLCERILVGDLAFTERGECEEVAMPATEGGSASSHDAGPRVEPEQAGPHQRAKSTEPKESNVTSDQEPVTTSAGEDGPDVAEDTDTEWERDDNETVPVRRVLRDEANSVAHYLLHRPGLPQHCEQCRQAKMKRKKRFCKAFSERAPEDVKYGMNVTSDHVNFRDI